MATKTQPLTLDELIARHADDIAYVAEKTPATTAEDFIYQLTIASGRLGDDDLTQAVAFLTTVTDACEGEDAAQTVFLNEAARCLHHVDELVEEYRLMVGD
ncbi:hypothetical protein [Streptomyces olivaceiscleroticus]|uniref:Uncharacterized protein n=1 Tax=Streptomyces olivaceiscleroticus TaxID=68245 RepID=A0ABN1BMT8_9ACTN